MGVYSIWAQGHKRGQHRKSAGGPAVKQGAALIHQVAVSSAGLDCRPGPLLKLPRWLPLSWGSSPLELLPTCTRRSQAYPQLF